MEKIPLKRELVKQVKFQPQGPARCHFEPRVRQCFFPTYHKSKRKGPQTPPPPTSRGDSVRMRWGRGGVQRGEMRQGGERDISFKSGEEGTTKFRNPVLLSLQRVDPTSCTSMLLFEEIFVHFTIITHIYPPPLNINHHPSFLLLLQKTNKQIK